MTTGIVQIYVFLNVKEPSMGLGTAQKVVDDTVFN